jgi:hypothetical protein
MLALKINYPSTLAANHVVMDAVPRELIKRRTPSNLDSRDESSRDEIVDNVVDALSGHRPHAVAHFSRHNFGRAVWHLFKHVQDTHTLGGHSQSFAAEVVFDGCHGTKTIPYFRIIQVLERI